MNEFSKEILAEIERFGVNNYDQRSALGMLRTWVDKREPIKRSDYGPFGAAPTKRDDLAEALVEKFEAHPLEVDEYYEVLAEVRAEINKPYFDPTMNGAKTNKTLLKPKDLKKSKAE